MAIIGGSETSGGLRIEERENICDFGLEIIS